jgi:hypothetical protein
MGVRCSLVGGSGDNSGVFLVRDIVNGEGILVVSVADVSTVVLLVWTAVDNALGVMNVSVDIRASRFNWFGNIGKIDEDQARKTGGVTWLSANRNTSPKVSFP